MENFHCNNFQKVYIETRKRSPKRLMFRIGPLGLILVFYWLYHMIGFRPYFSLYLTAFYSGIFVYLYYFPLFISGNYINKVVSACSVDKNSWTFITTRWFFKKELIINASKIIEFNRLESSSFKGAGNIWEASVFSNGIITNIYFLSNGFDNFEELKNTLKYSIII